MTQSPPSGSDPWNWPAGSDNTPDPSVAPPPPPDSPPPPYSPTQPLYGQPGAGYRPASSFASGAYPPAPSPPYPPAGQYQPGGYPPGTGPAGPGRPPAEPPRTKRGLWAVIAAAAVVALVILGGFLLFHSSKSDTAGTTTSPTPSATSSTVTFPTDSTTASDSALPTDSTTPTTSTSVPTSSTTVPHPRPKPTTASGPRTTSASPKPSPTAAAKVTKDQLVVAKAAMSYFHALARDDHSTFCPLIYPKDLNRILKEKHIPSCSAIGFVGKESLREKYAAFKVVHPGQILVFDTNASVLADSLSPSGLYSFQMRKTGGKWQLRFYND